jgi:hypothetical protein
VLILRAGKKGSKGLQVLAQSLILAYNRVWHEILLDNSSIVLLYHELLMPATFPPFGLVSRGFHLSMLFIDDISSFSLFKKLQR